MFKKLFWTNNRKCKNYIYPNLSQMLSCTEEEGRVSRGRREVGKLRVWPKEDLPFEIRQITRMMWYICIYPQHTKCSNLTRARWAEHISNLKNNGSSESSPKRLCGNSSTWAHDVCDLNSASSFYIKTCWQKSYICFCVSWAHILPYNWFQGWG